tara:strand:- start:235 stop:861 length:627 start_codon:yes stop_codon:yes gene_type:complete
MKRREGCPSFLDSGPTAGRKYIMHIINIAKKIDALLGFISRTFMIISAAALFLIAVMIGADVISRFFFNTSIVGVAEVVANALLVIAFLQLSYTIRVGGLLRTELTDSYAPWVVSRSLWLIGYLLGALLFFLIAYYSWDPMMSAWSRKTFEGHASLRIPTFPSRFAVVMFSGLASVNFIALSVRSLLVIIKGDDSYIMKTKEEDLKIG